MKTQAAESARITEQMTRFILMRPEVGFRLKQDGEDVVSSPRGATLQDAFVVLYGAAAARDMLDVGMADGPIRIHGLVSRPSVSRKTSAHQYIFINGRCVQSDIVSSAVREAYRTLVMTNQHAIVVLHITMPPDAVDVNVHPAKAAVRFLDDKSVYDAVATAVGYALRRHEEGAPAVSPAGPEVRAGGPAPVPSDAEVLLEYVPPKSAPEPVQATLAAPEKHAGPRLAGGARVPRMTALAQVLDTYILARTPDGFAIVDQHAAAERINLERLEDSVRGGKAVSQELIEPVVLELTAREISALDAWGDALAESGYAFEPFGGRTVRVTAVPVTLGRLQDAAAVRDAVMELAAGPDRRQTGDLRERVLAMTACRSAIKAGERLGLAAMQTLLDELCALKQPHVCAHGRPAWVELDRSELEKRFRRTV